MIASIGLIPFSCAKQSAAPAKPQHSPFYYHDTGSADMSSGTFAGTLPGIFPLLVEISS